MTRTIGLGHFTFLDLPPADLMKLAASTGFGFVGLRLHPVAPGGIFYDLPPGSPAAREIGDLMDATGISVYDIETVVIDAVFDPPALRSVLEQAANLKAERLNVCGDDNEPNRLQANFNALCELAASYGIGVDIECMKWRSVNSLAKCVELVSASGRTNAGVLIDALHLCRCGASARDIAAVPPEMIRSAQLCDAPITPPETIEAAIVEARGGRLIPGDGGLPLADIVAAIPVTAKISVELPMTNDQSDENLAGLILSRTQSLFTPNPRDTCQ